MKPDIQSYFRIEPANLPDPLTYASSLELLEIEGVDGASSYKVNLWSNDGLTTFAFVVMPYTWGWVGLKIAEGVLSGAGTSIFNQLFGGSSQDLSALLSSVLERISAIVRQAIAEDAKRRVEADLDSLQNLFAIYQNNKDASLLQPLLIKASDITFEALSLGLPTVGCFSIVGGLGLAILQEIHAHTKLDGDRKNIADFAEKLWQRHFSFIPLLGQFNASRFSDVIAAGFNGPPVWIYNLDGRIVGWYDDPFVAARERKNHIFREYIRLESEILAPLFVIADKWQALAVQLRSQLESKQ